MPDTSAPNAAFEQARQHFMAGLTALEMRRLDDAEASFSAALALVPGRVSTLVNLAATRLALGKFDQALRDADAVLAAEPDNRDGWYHRATALGSLQRLEEAVGAFERALKIDDRHAEIWWRHAQTLHALDRRDKALAAYRRALAIDATLADAWTRCGDILREQHRLGEAAEAFEQAIAHGADTEINRYLLASVKPQAQLPTTTPQAYVRTLFDGYAGDFDQHLVGVLGYQVHKVLASLLQPLAPAGFGSALDLGCGTGLCGALLRPHVKRLVGVDLSAPMLAKARALKVYDELLQADVIEHLVASDEEHDLVVAADVLIYLGELTPLFAAVRKTARPGALFGFSVELPTRDGAELELMPSLRYAHSEAYLRRLAGEHGYTVVSALKQPLRHDQRVPIDGLYVVLQRN